MSEDLWKVYLGEEKEPRQSEYLYLKDFDYSADAPAQICEIFSGAIFAHKTGPRLRWIEANTAEGLRKFLALEASLTDLQSERASGRIRGRRIVLSGWTLVEKVVSLSFSSHATAVREQEALEHSEEPQEASADLLAKLADQTLSREQLRKSILEAEVVSFNADQLNSLKPLLRQYIEQYRDSTDPADLIAVTSAIRKYVGILGREEVSSVGFILDAEHKVSVPPEIELEVTKMVVRKLSATLPQEANCWPELGGQLMDLARTYLNPRLLPRQLHGAIALNSVLGLALLREPHLSELHDILRGLRASWFKQLVVRRAQSIDQELARRFPENESRPHRESLESLVRAIRETP